MTVILIRHGRSTANTSGLLAGRTPGIGLDDRGRSQAADLPARLGPLVSELTAVVRSPLQRCAETVEPLVSACGDVPYLAEPGLAEVDYGEWSNRKIADLLTEPLWKVVQQQPSAAVFPGGEGLLDVSRRATATVRDLDRRHGGPDGRGLWVACSHGDVIKSILADALGMHLDQFQRIIVDPGSISVIHYGPARPYVHTVNNSGVLDLPRPPMAAGATVGGSTGA
ncbi:MAG: MSMEG_4193 family putative phosphomutase [Gordonia sp. (in: high G+C Gram-positive bacteria)]|uniref:MSMEG_4193 family putative phosphomutase n=1 Tax=Gordonia TaxID=2053 RepID=UPI003263E68B